MSRNFVILLVVLSAAVAGLIVFSKLRPRPDHQASVNVPTDTTPTPAVTQNPSSVQTPVDHAPAIVPTNVQIPVVKPFVPQIQTGAVARHTTIPVPVITNDASALETKPLPVLEKEYAATTNRDTR